MNPTSPRKNTPTKPSHAPRRPRHGAGAASAPSTSRALLILSGLAIAATVFVLTFHPIMDPDSWFHLALGRWIMDHDAFPRTDPFSFTAGDTPYVPSGWLMAFLMAATDRLYPESSLGPILLVTGALLIASALVLRRAARAGTVLPTSLVLLAGLQLGVSRYSPRPDVWSIPCLAALFFLLTRSWFHPTADPAEPSADANPGRLQSAPPEVAPLWFVPVVIVLWANLHAGVLLALPILASYLIWLGWSWIRQRDSQWLRAALPVAVACVAWVANPYGVGLVGLARRIETMPRVEWVMEWMPLFRTNFPLNWPTYGAVGVIGVVAAWQIVRNRRRFHPLEILWILGLLLLMFAQRRQVALAGIGIPLLLARHLPMSSTWLQNVQLRFKATAVWIAAAVICAVQIAGANGNGGGQPRFGRVCSTLPCYVADFLFDHTPPGQMFNSYNLGGYLLNILSPKTPVYIDGRLDVYPAPVWLDMLALEENRLSIDEFAGRYHIKTFVVTLEASFGDPLHLASRLAARPDYALVYFDDIAAVFVHREPATETYVNRLDLAPLDPWDLKKMTENLARAGNLDKAAAQMGRLLQDAPASAAVHSLAGYIAWAAGDREMASTQLGTAEAINPKNSLLTIVRNRLKLAEQAASRRRR